MPRCARCPESFEAGVGSGETWCPACRMWYRKVRAELPVAREGWPPLPPGPPPVTSGAGVPLPPGPPPVVVPLPPGPPPLAVGLPPGPPAFPWGAGAGSSRAARLGGTFVVLHAGKCRLDGCSAEVPVGGLYYCELHCCDGERCPDRGEELYARPLSASVNSLHKYCRSCLAREKATEDVRRMPLSASARAEARLIAASKTAKTLCYQMLLEAYERDPHRIARLTIAMRLIKKSAKFQKLSAANVCAMNLLEMSAAGSTYGDYYQNLAKRTLALSLNFAGDGTVGSAHTFAEMFCLDLHLFCLRKSDLQDAKAVVDGFNLLFSALMGPAFHALIGTGAGFVGGERLIEGGIDAGKKLAENKGMVNALREFLNDGTGTGLSVLGASALAAPTGDPSRLRAAWEWVKTNLGMLDPCWDLRTNLSPLAFAKCLCEYMIDPTDDHGTASETEALAIMRSWMEKEFSVRGGTDFFPTLLDVLRSYI